MHDLFWVAPLMREILAWLERYIWIGPPGSPVWGSKGCPINVTHMYYCRAPAWAPHLQRIVSSLHR